jgi:hypothetical protein
VDGDRRPATGQLGRAELALLSLGQRAKRGGGRLERDADLDVDPLGTELVVAAVRWPGRIDAHVAEAIGDVRQVGGEERGEVHLRQRLPDAHRRRRLGRELVNFGLDHPDSYLLGCVRGLDSSTHHRPPERH